MGRPRKTLTEEQIKHVEKLAAVLTQEEIADFLGISDRTLRRRLKDDPRVSAAYKKGRAAAISTVAASLLRQAKSGNIAAAIFYLKTQAGWRETQVVEVDGSESWEERLRKRLAERGGPEKSGRK